MALTKPKWNVYVDWDANGNFTGTYDELANEKATGDALKILIRRGRASAAQRNAVLGFFTPGAIVLELVNTTNFYSHNNTSSPITGLIRPGLEIKIEAVHNSITYPKFRGFVESFDYAQRAGKPVAIIQARDALDQLERNDEWRTTIQENQRVDQVLTAILDADGWPLALRDLDVADETLEFAAWWLHTKTIDALRKAGATELIGQLFASNDGKVTFRNSTARSRALAKFTITEAETAEPTLHLSDYRDEVIYSWAGLQADTVEGVIYTDLPAGRAIAPGSTDARNKIDIVFNAMAKDVQTPVVGTEITGNSAQDGSGSNLTGSLTLDIFTVYGWGAHLEFTSSEPTALVYLDTFEIDGKLIHVQAGDRRLTVPVVQPVVSNSPQVKDFPFHNDAAVVEAQARFDAAILALDRDQPAVILTPADDTTMANSLGLELSERVDINRPAGLYTVPLVGEFFVEQMVEEVDEDANLRQSLVLWHTDKAGGNVFLVSPDAGDAFSEIWTDAAATGPRIR